MSTPKWTILIATVGMREDKFKRTYENLAAQIEEFCGDVTALVYWDNFESTLGKVRQDLLEAATSTYVNYVDDDDVLPPYYCRRIYDLLDNKVDYIGWRMQLFIDGEKQKPTFHSIRYKDWDEDEYGYYRDVSHLNPIKRTLALKGRFDQSIPEDRNWASQVAPHIKTEKYIDEEMYYYYHSRKESLWKLVPPPKGSFIRPVLDSQYFYYHPKSSL
ncbi:MAG TPA: hypothetical protein VJ742_12035 [Nitrososphaera sp.]|nr:hypothetical protein [Nitrososphaera sp.]